MTNWLADPVACVLRLKYERGCNIMAGRNEVLSRSTRCYVTEEHDGTYWRSGHLYAKRVEDAKGRPVIVGGSHGVNVNHTTETAYMEPEQANTLSDLLRAAYANSGTQACGGKTLLEVMWEELMAIYERLVTGQEAEDGRDPGRAEGLAYAISVMNNPYLPNIEHVRTQAAERWDNMENNDPPEPPKPTRAQKRAARRVRRG